MVSKRSLQNGGTILYRYVPHKKLLPPTSRMLMNSYNQMFNTKQIPDNPGYTDFNLPTPRNNCGINSVINCKSLTANSEITENKVGVSTAAKKQSNGKFKQKDKQLQQNITWRNNNQQEQGMKRVKKLYDSNVVNFASLHNRFPRQYKNRMGKGSAMAGRPSTLPIVITQPGTMHDEENRSFINEMQLPPSAFQPTSIFPPVQPPVGGQLPQLLSYTHRRNGQIPPMQPQLPSSSSVSIRMRHSRASSFPPIQTNNGGNIKSRRMRNYSKSKSTIKTLKNLVNQYPIGKPWVTEEIRAEYDKKVDIEERLKGHKNDNLFAQFKLQRDKFVSMYESARDEYIKQEADAIKAKARATLLDMV